MKYSFGSDNNSGVHPRVLEAIQDANHHYAKGYGDDKWTEKAKSLFKEEFSSDIEIAFCFGGTGANILALAVMSGYGSAVLCSSKAHIYADECGAPERLTGIKLVPLPCCSGAKITAASIDQEVRERKGSIHAAQITGVSLTVPTESGALYSLDELESIGKICKTHNLRLHIDGARICNAAVALSTSFNTIVEASKADVVTFGGTKNGLMCAEAVITFDPDLNAALPFVQKQFLQLSSKNRFISSQFIPFLEEKLWHQNAVIANAMAKELGQVVSNISGCTLVTPVEVNMVFFSAEEYILNRLLQETYFNVSKGIARLVASFDTNKSAINDFREHLAAASTMKSRS